jgi:hypothetical protein
MDIVRSVNLQKNLGDVLNASDKEPVLMLNREQPRTVLMSSEEYVRLKLAAGEPVPPEVVRPKPTFFRRPVDPLGYDTSDFTKFAVTVADDAIAKNNQEEVDAEVENSLRRWGMRG